MEAKFIPVLDGQSLITQQKSPTAVVLELQKVAEHIATDDLVFLGLQDDGTPFFSAACQESITDVARASDGEVEHLTSLSI